MAIRQAPLSLSEVGILMATQEQLDRFKCEKPVSRWVSRGEVTKTMHRPDFDLHRLSDPPRDGYCVEVLEDCGICVGCLSRLVIQMVEGVHE